MVTVNSLHSRNNMGHTSNTATAPTPTHHFGLGSRLRVVSASPFLDRLTGQSSFLAVIVVDRVDAVAVAFFDVGGCDGVCIVGGRPMSVEGRIFSI